MDHASTTPLWPAIKEVMASEILGNPSSIHHFGKRVRARVESARETIAQSLDVKPAQVIFTSGGTEANGIVMNAFKNKRSFCSAIEHDSVRLWVPPENRLPVTSKGELNINIAAERLQKHRPHLLAIMAANNETGVIQPLDAIVPIAQKYQTWVHVDGVQLYGKKVLSFPRTGWDSLALSAHKIGGPTGIGALILKEKNVLPPLWYGGSQEKYQRPGTQNVIGVLGFAEAVKEIQKVDWSPIEALRHQIEKTLHKRPEIMFYGTQAPHLPSILAFAHSKITGIETVIALDLEGIAISSGPACSSGQVKPSHVLKAMGVARPENGIRLSLGWQTTAEETSCFLAQYQCIIDNGDMS